jgi:hypothetical protein
MRRKLALKLALKRYVAKFIANAMLRNLEKFDFWDHFAINFTINPPFIVDFMAKFIVNAMLRKLA